jgi:hypothetical protein
MDFRRGELEANEWDKLLEVLFVHLGVRLQNLYRSDFQT